MVSLNFLPFDIKKERMTLKSDFFNNPNHFWINYNPVLKRIFNLFLDSFPDFAVKFFAKDAKINFIKSSGELALCVSGKKREPVILLFPDLVKLLHSAQFGQALSVLAHELGHIYYRHGDREISSIDSQYEADKFACELGYKEDLIFFLNNNSSNAECQLRLVKLSK